MKHKQFICATLLISIVLAGCSSDDEQDTSTMVETQAIEEGDYGATLPFTSSDSRQKHSVLSRSLVDSMNIGTGLLDYSASHFSTKNYTIQEGIFLAYDELTSLLGREREANPDGLNPNSETSFETGNGAVKAPVIVRDIYEVNFIKNKEVKGLSLAIVLNSQVSENGSGTTITEIKDETLRAYGEETAMKLVTYMRKMPEIGDNLPIYVALYKDTTSDDTLPGAFFAEAYFEGRSASFSSIKEQWAMFPGTTASKLDGNAVTQFTQIKNALNGFLPDDVNIIGRGKFQNDKLSELRITVNMYAKTATEAISLTQYLKSQLSNFSSLEYKIQVEIRCQDETIATMIRNVGEKDVITNMLI